MAAVRRPKSGRAKPEEYEIEYMTSKFTAIRERLLRQPGISSDAKLVVEITNANLAILSCSLQMFMDDFFGRNSPQPWPITRLPSKCFRNFAPDGPLYTILFACYKYKVCALMICRRRARPLSSGPY